MTVLCIGIATSQATCTSNGTGSQTLLDLNMYYYQDHLSSDQIPEVSGPRVNRKYYKVSKFLMLKNFAVIYLKFKQRGQTFGDFPQKDANGIANSEDPDLGLHCLPRHICPET